MLRSSNNKKTAWLATGLYMALSFVFVQSAAWAQNSVTGAISGIVTDSTNGEKLDGVTVVVASTALQYPQTEFTDNGQYKITSLPPGMYTVSFFYGDDSKPALIRKNIRVNINTTTPVFAKIAPGSGEVIEMTGAAPTVDATKTDQGIKLDSKNLLTVPRQGNTFEGALGAAAGTAGDALGVSFSGSTSLENQYIVDGVNTTGLSFGTVGTPLLREFIQEIEVITGGYNAEYGRATGGIAQVVTKSGTNEFHGSIFSRVTPGSLVAEFERTPIQTGPIDIESNLDFDAMAGFEIGGPIIKDKLWFYAGIVPTYGRTRVERITKSFTDCRNSATGPCDPAANGDGIPDRDENGLFYFDEIDNREFQFESQSIQALGKLNYSHTPEHQGQITMIGNTTKSEGTRIFGTPLETESTGNTLDASLKWTSKFFNNDTEVEGQLGYHRSAVKAGAKDASFDNVPLEWLRGGNLSNWAQIAGAEESNATVVNCTDNGPDDLYPFITNCLDSGPGYFVGGTGGLTDLTEQRLSGRLSAIQRVRTGKAGNHEIKAGIDFEKNNLDKIRQLSGGYFAENRLGSTIELRRWARLGPDGTTDPRFDETCENVDPSVPPRACDFLDEAQNVEGETLNLAGYLRDSWQILPNLTFNAGLRYEEQRLRYSKELQNTVDPLTGRTLGKDAMVLKEMWAPRIGLLYDWTKEGRSKIYGNWGRFYESIPLNINDRSFGGEVTYRQIFDATTCGPTVTGYGGAGAEGCIDPANGASITSSDILGSGVLVAPNVKAQFLDETIIGMEYEILEDLKIGMSLQNRRLGRILEDVSVDNAQTYILANPGQWSDADTAAFQEVIDNTTDVDERERLEAELEQYQGIAKFDEPRRDYNAFQFIVTKRFSRNLFLQASYTFSRTKGNYPGLFSEDNGQIDPNISSQFDLIELLANRDGPLPQDRPHYIKVDGYYSFDFGSAGLLTPAIRYRALSGIPIDALASHYRYGDRESFLLPRGAIGRLKFQWDTDFSLNYKYVLKNGWNVEAYVDIFNLFNRQGDAAVDEQYTRDDVNPIVGGGFEDVVFAKKLTIRDGTETSDPVTREKNFLNVGSRFGSRSFRFGMRLTF